MINLQAYDWEINNSWQFSYGVEIFFFYGFFWSLILVATAQTEFDSLKRINVDTSYRPSDKPTFVTEFAEVKISGFIQPGIYSDNNNVLNNDLFVTCEIPTTEIANKNSSAFIFPPTKASILMALYSLNRKKK